METDVAPAISNCENENDSDKNYQENITKTDMHIIDRVNSNQKEGYFTKSAAEQSLKLLSLPISSMSSSISSASSPTQSTSSTSSYYSPPSSPRSSEPSLSSSLVLSSSTLVDEEVTSEIAIGQSRRSMFPLEESNTNASYSMLNISKELTREIHNVGISGNAFQISKNDVSNGVAGSSQHPGVDNAGLIATSQELPKNSQYPRMPTGSEELPENHLSESENKYSTKKEKNIWMQKSMSIHLSKMYALTIFILGSMFYVADTFSKSEFVLAEVFNICIMSVQVIWLAFVHYDIRKYLKFVSETVSRAQDSNQYLDRSETNKSLKKMTATDRYYGFTSGRHCAGGSFYLKGGAAVFFFGYLIYVGLHLGVMIQHITDDSCYHITQVIMDVIEIINVTYQLFFVFKYSNLIINRWINLSRFGVMHCIATSGCLWFYFIYGEILAAIDRDSNHNNSFEDMGTHDPITLPEPIIFDPLNSTATTVTPVDNWVMYYGCRNSSEIEDLLRVVGPYLYPFAVEFNLVIIGLWIAIWQNFGKMEYHTHYPSVLIKTEEDNSKSFSSNLNISVDCHSSNRGLFTGLLAMIMTLIAIVVFFVYAANGNPEPDELKFGLILRAITEGVLLLVLLITTITAFYSLSSLDISKTSIRSVDKILLLITLPFIFFFALCNMASYLDNEKRDILSPEEIIYLSVMILYVIQPVIQTVFICDSLYRCANTMELQKKKPGRETVTFLIVTNVTMWLFETLQINTTGANKEGLDYYNIVTWQIITHITMPLAVFFRFHSSACLAEIWSYAYEVDG